MTDSSERRRAVGEGGAELGTAVRSSPRIIASAAPFCISASGVFAPFGLRVAALAFLRHRAIEKKLKAAGVARDRALGGFNPSTVGHGLRSSVP